MTRRSPSQYDWGKVLFDETFMTHSFTPQASKNVEAIVVHHAVIVGSDERALDTIWNVWQTSGTSAHYGVVGPYVRQYVRDKDYAWAVGDTHGNATTISIEHVNSALAPGYQVAESTWKTGAKLVAHLHKAYGLGRPVSGRTLRMHSSYSSTACPGPYLGDAVWAQYVAEAQRVYDTIGAANGAPKEEDDMTPAQAKDLETVKKQVADLHDRLAKIDKLAFNVNGGSGAEGIREVIGKMRTSTLSISKGVAALVGRDPHVIDAKAIAEAIPNDIAQQVIDALTAQLNK